MSTAPATLRRKCAPHTIAAKQREYDRWYVGGHGPKSTSVTVPEDIERFEDTRVSCFNCGESGRCKHRPWLSA